MYILSMPRRVGHMDMKAEDVPLPDFMTSAKRELMLSAAFLVFLAGAIVALRSRDY